MTKSDINYVDESWSPMSGCSKISEGCEKCYAKAMATRFAGSKAFPNGFAVTTYPDRLDPPWRWRKPRRVFVCPTGDLFHDQVPDEFIRQVWRMMWLLDNHDFLVLTKRPQRMLQFLSGWRNWIEDAHATTNIWCGVTAENQQRADERIPILLQVPAARRWISVEPMLSAVHLAPEWIGGYPESEEWAKSGPKDPRLSWLVCGGENGPGARPMHPDWARGLRDECAAAGVPFWWKGWGAWLPDGQAGADGYRCTAFSRWGGRRGPHWILQWVQQPGRERQWDTEITDGQLSRVYDVEDEHRKCGEWVFRLGSKAAGHLLDGVEHRGLPEVAP